MRISNLTRKAMSEVMCIVLAFSILGMTPSRAQAETRQECVDRVTQKYNDDVMACYGALSSDQDDCTELRRLAYILAEQLYNLRIDLIEGDYDIHYDRCLTDEETEIQECDGTQTMCHQDSYNTFLALNLVCYLTSNPGLCQMLNYILHMSAVSQCNSRHQTCVENANRRRRDCIADAEEIKRVRSEAALETRTGRELTAQINYGLCIAASWTNFLSCIGRALLAEQAGLLACPADGHGAHDAPPAGHDAPPPPAGHGAPPPPAGHGAP